MQLISIVRSFVSLPIALMHWVRINIVTPPKTSKKSLPPIRYDGDPTDIYLA